VKIQCSCGAKYEFDITPEMAQSPVQFVCPACNQDISDSLNGQIRSELTPAEVALEAVVDVPLACLKHPGQKATEKCCVCSKPICPKCMELFGYACSPLCKARAEARGIRIPVYAGQKSLVEARFWRKTGLMAAAISVVIVGAIAFWFWYAWFGSMPKTAFSVRFSEPAYSGQSSFCGKDQLVFLHGGTLARYDLKQKKQVWSRELVDQKTIEADAAKTLAKMQASVQLANQEHPDTPVRLLSPDRLAVQMQREEEAALDLQVQNRNIWVLAPGKLVRYEWDTGKTAKEIPLHASPGELILLGDELLLMESHGTNHGITHISLTTGELRSEEVVEPGAATKLEPARARSASTPLSSQGAGLPVGVPGKEAGRVMDPEKVAEQAQRMSKPAKIALPALLANSRNQERLLAELNDSSRPKPRPNGASAEPIESFSVIPTRGGFVQYSVRLLETKVVERLAMKGPPTKSALDGNVTATKTTEVANEILNDMQRSRGGDIVREDESRYLVKIRLLGGKDEWSGEVIGPPALYPLDTVNVLAAGKTLLVFDKMSKRLWQSTLSYSIQPARGGGLYGGGPCVEHKGSLYVFDAGVLTAFDLGTGTARWRLPSVGIAGLLFDDQENLYVNTTTAGLEKLKYSRQIDIAQQTSNEVLKIDSRTGKPLWKAQPGGLVSYVSGRFVYVVQSYTPDEEDPDSPPVPETGFETPPYVRIKRLNPRNGNEMWEHFQQRAPLDVEFDQNTIRLVFKKEVQVLKFLAF
jgi:hypothetical protein